MILSSLGKEQGEHPEIYNNFHLRIEKKIESGFFIGWSA